MFFSEQLETTVRRLVPTADNLRFSTLVMDAASAKELIEQECPKSKVAA